MITIDIVHEYEEKTEKPQSSQPIKTAFALHPGTVDSIYHLALERQQALIHVAHAARLANLARQGRTEGATAGSQVPVDVQRYGENNKASSTILERYVRRVRALVQRN